MSGLIVYHGGTEIIDKPLCKIGRKNLDFGQGFYITNIRTQAVSWAQNIALKRGESPILNVYNLNKDGVLKNFRCKIFTAYDAEWLDFIVENRMGHNAAKNFDYVEGGVANDRIIDTVNLYISGIIGNETALKRLSEHQPNNQMCILNQKIIDNYLVYNGTKNIK
ncbi:MAG: DUF3990 domain-containing protein [Bacteroidales bacterium]|nr:DUF3990 domain-containing protein [Bacteroidales bacterium]